MLIKPVTPELYFHLFELQNEVHPSYLCESMTVLTSKVYVSPSTCFAVQESGDLTGYILALPFPYGEMPPLAESVEPLETDSPLTNLHLHDCAVSPLRRKSGIAAKMIHHLEQVAVYQGYSQISLVAVHGMSSFWARHGWKVTAVPVLEEYGDSVYMVKDIKSM